MKPRTDEVHIYKGRADRYRVLHSSSKWFDGCEYFIIKDDANGCLRIIKCYLEIPKNAQKRTTGFQFVSELPIGTFKFDEDSTEDELIIYYLE
jgi:hypothetical protein